MKLEQLGKNTFVLYGKTNIGFYLFNNNDVVVIDTGLNNDSAKQILEICQNNNWNIKCVVNTHAHADHVGGNNYIQNELNIPIYANKMNILLCKYPHLQTVMAYGGYPSKELSHPLLVPLKSEVAQIENNILPGCFEIIDLPGHLEDMIGFKTDDGVIFLSDAVTGINLLDKARLQFIYDIEGNIKTLNKIKDIKGTYFVPSHGEITKNVNELVEKNKKNINYSIDLLKDVCNSPKTFDEIMKAIFDHFHMKMNSIQYNIIAITIKCYLSYMLNENLIINEMDNNLLLWETTKKKG